MNLRAIDPTASGADRGKSAARAWLRALEATAPIAAQPHRILPAVIEELAESRGEAPALLSDRECLTYRELAARANRYARWALAHGLGKGDAVCLLMPNRPEYLAIWLGVTRVGGVVALLNTNLTGASLAHCINIVSPQHVIVAAELGDAFASARPHLACPATVWTHGADASSGADIEREIERHSDLPLSGAELRPVSTADRALLIYTSGTTGLPKAANVSHHRLMTWSLWFAGMMDTRADDRMYDCLPLYHSVGGIVATGAVLVHGGAVVIRPKFSARQFWDDVARFDCTLFQYIGELCRYLVNADPHPHERKHRIRLACGNGLRADVWKRFESRFAIPRILEFYAATEGNFSLYNAEGEPGAIGRVPPFLAGQLPTALIRLDPQTGAPMRDANGFAIRCGTDEPGEAIGRLPDTSACPGKVDTDFPSGDMRQRSKSAGGRFEGYTDADASEKKVLRNAFEAGDAWFRTGDLMRKDARGFFHFVDRIGDTFRWKGENVATSEVADAMSEYPGIEEANVYGVAIPGCDGRAGMAAVVAAPGLDLAGLREHLIKRLPDYARPLFLRIRGEMEVTGTFKHKKADLAEAGFDPSQTSDAIYFNDASRGAFVRLDAALYERIRSQQMRV